MNLSRLLLVLHGDDEGEVISWPGYLEQSCISML